MQTNRNRNIAKNGFTLVELAIVLVVIGLLMGMAFKGKTLVDAARIKAEVTKIQKISTAINTYMAKYDSLPGQLDNGTVQNNQEMFNTLIAEGMLKESDFKSVGTGGQGGGGWWNFVGCQEFQGANGRAWKVSPASNQSNLCVYRSSTKTSENTNNGAGGDPGQLMDGLTICQIETLLDDKNVYSGDGRSTTATISGSGGGTLDNTNWDCANTDPAIHGGTTWGYAFRVY